MKLNAMALDSLEGTSYSIGVRENSAVEVVKNVNHILKQKWFGATRVGVGFSVDRMTPCVAGGISYTQLRNIFAKAEDTDIKNRASDRTGDFSD